MPFAVVRDAIPPAAGLDSITEDSPYAYVAGDTVYYGQGEGSFQVRVSASDATAGLDRAEYPATVSVGGVYTQALGGAYQYAHTYTFTSSSTAEGTYRVAVYDRAGNGAEVPFTVTCDDVAPVAGVSVPGKVPTGTFTVTWSAMDDDSGVAVYDVQVKVDDGDWTSWLTATTDTEAMYSGELGHRYTFRARATDHVSNTGAWSAEAGVMAVRVIKYYTFGGQRVAMRQGGVVYYIHTDHLGSTSLVTDHASHVTARQRYYPYGEVRWSAGTLPTDFTFTGQRAEAGLGLMDYRARYYDPVLGRFVSVDTIVPEPGNPQDLNRYAYVYNNPLRYTDPSGHRVDPFGVGARDENELPPTPPVIPVPVPTPPPVTPTGTPTPAPTVRPESTAIATTPGWTSTPIPLVVAGPDGPVQVVALPPLVPSIELDASKVDWVGASLDTGGIVLDAISLGMAGKAADVAKLATDLGKVGDLTAFARSWSEASIAAMRGDRSGYEVIFGPEATNLYVDAADLALPVPFLFDAVGLVMNFSLACEITSWD